MLFICCTEKVNGEPCSSANVCRSGNAICNDDTVCACDVTDFLNTNTDTCETSKSSCAKIDYQGFDML